MMKYIKLKIIGLVWVVGFILILSNTAFGRRVRENFYLNLNNGEIIFPGNMVIKLKEITELSEELYDFEIAGIGEKGEFGIVNQFFVPKKNEVALIKVYPERWDTAGAINVEFLSSKLKQLVIKASSNSIEKDELADEINSFITMLGEIKQEYGKKFIVEIKGFAINSETAISSAQLDFFINALRDIKTIASKGNFMFINDMGYFNGMVEVHYHPGEVEPPSIKDLINWFGVERETVHLLLGYVMYRGIIVNSFEGKKLLLFKISHQNMGIYHKLLHIEISFMIEQAIKDGDKDEEIVWRALLKDIGENEPLKDWYQELEKLALKDENGEVPILVPSQ